MTIPTQRVASVARQLLAIVAITFGVITQSDSALHLPVAISSILAVAGAVIIAIEHYVGDPSTGTLTTDTPAGPAPVAPVAPPSVAPQRVPSLPTEPSVG